MAQQYSTILFWICLFVACCSVLGNSTTIDASVTAASSAPLTTPLAPVTPTSGGGGGGGGSGSVSSGGVTSAVPNTATSTGRAGYSASSIAPGSGPTTPAAKVNCINGTTADWSGAQNVSGSCQSSTCWVYATYADDKVTEIKMSCAQTVKNTPCNPGECSYKSGSCECCCNANECNKKSFDKECDGARASSKGVRLSPPWLGLVALVLVMMKTM